MRRFQNARRARIDPICSLCQTDTGARATIRHNSSTIRICLAANAVVRPGS
jgi:hypothetical protein